MLFCTVLFRVMLLLLHGTHSNAAAVVVVAVVVAAVAAACDVVVAAPVAPAVDPAIAAVAVAVAVVDDNDSVSNIALTAMTEEERREADRLEGAEEGAGAGASVVEEGRISVGDAGRDKESERREREGGREKEGRGE